MRKLLNSLFILTILLFVGQKIVAQDPLTDNSEFYLYPENPGSNDSVYFTFTYISTDGCPDFTARIDSAIDHKIYINLERIVDSTRICTLVISKFKINLNLGTIQVPTGIYLNGKLIKTYGSECIPNRIGRVVAYTENSTLIQEDTTNLIFQIYKQTLKMGTLVKFNGTEIQCIKAPCFNIVNCFKIIDTVLPPCEQNRKGIIVQGKYECANRLFIQEYSPISSSLQLWNIAIITADAYFKPGDQVVFGGLKVLPDTAQNFYCRVVGNATCIKKIQSSAEMVELSGSAKADSVTIQSGYAVLYAKNQRKAIDSTPLKDGKFYFKGIKNNAYTVFVLPDKRMYPGYLPTFYKDRQNWKMADFIILNDSSQTVQIELLKYIQTDGNGKINGRIQYQNDNLKDSTFIANGTYIENKSGIDSSACNIPVILYDNSQKAIAWTLTDDNGFYSFEKVLAGIYTIIAETPIASAETSVSLIDETETLDVNLMLKSTESSTVLINPNNPQLKIYPNPVEDNCYLDVPQNGIISIYSISGQILMQKAVNAGLNTINLARLKAGLHLLKYGDNVLKLRKL